jgi:hypothetical protein
MVQQPLAILATMVDPATPYAARLQEAMRAAGRDPADTASVGWLAERLGVSYQAARKALSGDTKALTAENNVKAARVLGVSSEWLATGDGPRSGAGSPFSADLLRAIEAAPPSVRRQAENAARNVLDLDPLPRESGESGDSDAIRKSPSAKAA